MVRVMSTQQYSTKSIQFYIILVYYHTVRIVYDYTFQYYSIIVLYYSVIILYSCVILCYYSLILLYYCLIIILYSIYSSILLYYYIIIIPVVRVTTFRVTTDQKTTGGWIKRSGARDTYHANGQGYVWPGIISPARDTYHASGQGYLMPGITSCHDIRVCRCNLNYPLEVSICAPGNATCRWLGLPQTRIPQGGVKPSGARYSYIVVLS